MRMRELLGNFFLYSLQWKEIQGVQFVMWNIELRAKEEEQEQVVEVDEFG